MVLDAAGYVDLSVVPPLPENGTSFPSTPSISAVLWTAIIFDWPFWLERPSKCRVYRWAIEKSTIWCPWVVFLEVETHLEPDLVAVPTVGPQVVLRLSSARHAEGRFGISETSSVKATNDTWSNNVCMSFCLWCPGVCVARAEKVTPKILVISFFFHFGAQFIMAKKTAIGIDLGTTYSPLAWKTVGDLPKSAPVWEGHY